MNEPKIIPPGGREWAGSITDSLAALDAIALEARIQHASTDRAIERLERASRNLRCVAESRTREWASAMNAGVDPIEIGIEPCPHCDVEGALQELGAR